MTAETRIAKLEKVQAKAKGGPERIVVSYPDGRAFYYCGKESLDLAYGDPLPEHDYHIRVIYEDVPLPQHGAELDLHRGGDN